MNRRQFLAGLGATAAVVVTPARGDAFGRRRESCRPPASCPSSASVPRGSEYPYRETVRVRYTGSVACPKRYLGVVGLSDPNSGGIAYGVQLRSDPDEATAWDWHYNQIRYGNPLRYLRVGTLRSRQAGKWLQMTREHDLVLLTGSQTDPDTEFEINFPASDPRPNGVIHAIEDLSQKWWVRPDVNNSVTMSTASTYPSEGPFTFEPV
jgi:hypothetical protein